MAIQLMTRTEMVVAILEEVDATGECAIGEWHPCHGNVRKMWDALVLIGAVQYDERGNWCLSEGGRAFLEQLKAH